MIINNGFRKMVLVFLFLAFTLTVVTPGWAVLTFERQQCPDNQVKCGAGHICANLQTSVANCGSCGYHCKDKEICMSGACKPIPKKIYNTNGSPKMPTR